MSNKYPQRELKLQFYKFNGKSYPFKNLTLYHYDKNVDINVNISTTALINDMKKLQKDIIPTRDYITDEEKKKAYIEQNKEKLQHIDDTFKKFDQYIPEDILTKSRNKLTLYLQQKYY